MRTMSSVLVTVLLAGSAAPALAMNWSLGANLGLSVITPSEGGDNVTLISWPSNNFVTLFSAPGIRIGFTGANPQHEVYVDTGLMIITGSGLTISTVQLSGNYQYAFNAQGSASPYVTGGVGLASFSESNFGSVSAISPVFGGGIGVRHKMGNGHGTLRAEARFDHVNEGDDGGVVVIDAVNAFGLKLGFDLWDK